MRLEGSPRQCYDLRHLRAVHSVGEPLNPEAVLWGQEALGLPIHDNWWQTETGGIMIANYPAMDIRPGSMGRPLPGIEAAIVRRIGEQEVEVVQAPDVEGELALKPGWPSMFRGYLHDEQRYAKCFVGGWYLTGDLARRDADGYFWFVGRADDIIKTSGHMVGPFEVESALMEHQAVAEAGVIGKPDDRIGELVKAFVSLKTHVQPSEALRLELLGFARQRLGHSAERDCLSGASAQDQQWQNHAAPAQSPRAGFTRGRHFNPGDQSMSAAALTTATSPPVERAHALHLLHQMVRIRRLESKAAELYGASKIRGFMHLYDGEEAVAVGVMAALTPVDAVVATYREHGQALPVACRRQPSWRRCTASKKAAVGAVGVDASV